MSAADAEPLELSIVMPSLNEAETIEFCIEEAHSFLERSGVRGEVIVADNGSTDGSREIAAGLGARVVHASERGYGAALQAGIAAARGRYVVIGDADASYDFLHLDSFVDRLRGGDDLVIGNRFVGGIEPGAMPFLHRYLGNPTLSFLGRLFYGTDIRDSQCGLRAFNKSAFEKLDLRTTGMEFASEMVVKATLGNLKVSEVPTTLRPDGRSRPPHLQSWRDGWRHLRFLLLYSPRWLFLYPGLAFIVAGLAIMAWLLPHPRTIGHVVLDAQTLLFAGAAVVLGYQAVLFALLGRVFGEQEGLLPKTRKLDRALKKVTLESGILSGAVLAVAGVVGAFVAVAHWRSRDFGSLDFSRSMRVVVPSVVALMVGIETVLASFFLSLLEIPRRR